MVYDEDAAMIANKLKQKFSDFNVKILDFDNNGLIIER
jgi:homoserine kinase